MSELTRPHEPALMLLFAELEGAAEEQTEAFLGTPGSLAERTNRDGVRYWVHRYLDATGLRRETYLGKSDDHAVTASVAALRGRIEAANAAIGKVRILARTGFATVDRKAYATLASLHNHGLFRAGALLIGSHAYGALLNTLGVRAAAYTTQDIDIARREALALPRLQGFLHMLRETGIEFHEVPIPELSAHAKGLPYLAYLLGASQNVPILSPHGIAMVGVPVPERFAVHKLIVSQQRTRATGKPEKDLRQAATLLEAVSERFPGALEDALAVAPKSASKYIARATKALEHHLPPSAEGAWEALRSRNIVRPA